MQIDILLISVPPWSYEEPPLGIACLSSYLKSINVNVGVLDVNIDIYRNSPAIIKEIWDNKEKAFLKNNEFSKESELILERTADNVLLFNCEILGFSVSSHTGIHFSQKLIKKIKDKNPEKKVIVGGPAVHFFQHRSVFDNKYVDFFVIGKGCYALEGILAQIGVKNARKRKLKIWQDYPDACALCVEATENYYIEDVPFPTFGEFDLKLYTNQGSLPVLASEGCLRDCIFCFDKVLAGAYRMKNVSTVIEAIRYYYDKYGISRIHFVDSLMNGNLKLLEKFCDLLIESGIPISYEAQMVIRADMNKILFKKVKDSGCTELQLGVESFSDNVLKILRKGFTVREAIENITEAKSAGLNVSIFLVVGCPGETEQDLENTFDNLRKYAKYIDKVGNLNLLCIPPETYLYKHLNEYDIVSDFDNARPEFDGLRWRTKDNSNNLTVRLERYNRLKNVLEELDIPFNDNVKKMWF